MKIPGLRKINFTNCAGYTTLEIMVAFAVLVIGISGVTTVAFGNQSVSVDTQKNSEAVQIGKAALESIQAEAQGNFSNIVTAPCTSQSGYSCKVNVFDVNTVTKQVNVTVGWTTDTRSLNVSLNSLVTDLAGTVAAGNPPGNPGNPNPPAPPGGGSGGGPSHSMCPTSVNVVGRLDTSTAIGSIGTYATGVSVARNNSATKMAYISAVPAGNVTTANDFFTVDVTDPTNPILNNARSISTGTGGLNAVEVVGNYAYAVSVDPTHQLQIIDLSQNPPVATGYKLPGNGSQGLSLFYYNNRLYVGTANDAGPEFFVYDVTNPVPNLLGSYEVGASVNKIKVNGQYAYLSTSDPARDVVVLDVSNVPTSLGSAVAVYNAPSANGSNSNYLLGGTLYLGNMFGSPKNFTEISTASMSELASVGITGANNVYDMLVAGGISFLGTDKSNGQLQVYDVSAPGTINYCLSQGFYNSSLGAYPAITGVTSSDNLLYVVLKDQSPLRIIQFSY
jgi:type II secretory pathway pseudopilin PulG